MGVAAPAGAAATQLQQQLLPTPASNKAASLSASPAAATVPSSTPSSLTRRGERPPCACSHLHPHKSCLAYLVSSFGRSFYLAYGIRAGISLALHVIRLLRTRPRDVLSIEKLVGAHGLPADAVRMGLFLGGFTGIFNGMRCVFARWTGKDNVATVMASGALAGLAINFHPADSHRTLALYVLARVFQCWYNKATVAGKWHLWGGDWPHGDSLLFSICSAQVMYAYVMRPDTLPPAYLKFIVDTGPIVKPVLDACRMNNRGQPIDLDALQTAVTKLSPGKDVRAILGDLAKRVYGAGASPALPPIVPCSILHAGQDVCHHQWSKTFVDAAKRSLPLYTAVTFVPMLILRFWAVVRHPIDSLLRGTFSVARSTTFLSSFVTIYMFTCCMHRRAFARDHRAVYWVAGFVSAWTILMEQKSRRSELALYVLPRALDSLLQALHDRRLLSRIPYGEKLLFCAGMSALMYYREYHPDSMSPLLKRVLNFFVPTYHSMPKEHGVVAHGASEAPLVGAGGAHAEPSVAGMQGGQASKDMPGLLRGDSDGLSASSIESVIPLPTAGISFSREQSSSQLGLTDHNGIGGLPYVPSFITNSTALPTCQEDGTSSAGAEAAQTLPSFRPVEAASYGNLFARDVSPGVSPESHTRGVSSGASESAVSSSPPFVPHTAEPAPVQPAVSVSSAENGAGATSQQPLPSLLASPSPSQLEPSPPSGATLEPASAPPQLPHGAHERRASADAAAPTHTQQAAANGSHANGHGKQKRKSRK